MRWTSTLHGRFIHAVELLGGHESKASSLSLFLSCVCEFFCALFKFVVSMLCVREKLLKDESQFEKKFLMHLDHASA